MQNPTGTEEERGFRDPDAHTPDGAPVKSGVQARQGVISGRILTVLTVGLVLVVLALTISYCSAG
ncbi:hypothetical protein [Xanthobacter oligotrophicus]|uniref:hypothetical protein n=1 Tax=Xanthobacter oligotrophicus TaxID=2607286 RepID=UPI0011F3AD74|nr:hypothetical protein [Xanthobacter oligotrophicus]MCG5233560.1 hypothetical protein [Xanthobacter oligotrophicus]